MRSSANAPWANTAFGVDENGGSPIVIKGVRRGRSVTFTPADSTELNVRSEQAAVIGCLLQRESFIRWLTAPIASPRKAEAVFPSLLDIQLPFSVEECEVSLLEMRPALNPVGTQGLVAGARGTDIEKRLAALSELGLDPHVLDQEGIALWSQCIKEYPAGSDAPEARILVYNSKDRVTLVAGLNGALLGDNTMRHMHPGQVIRMLKSIFPEIPASTQWLWAGPSATHSLEVQAYQATFSSRWPGPMKIVRDPDTFLARALVTRALLNGTARCNLRSGIFLHAAVARQEGKRPYRWAAACLAAGLLLCAVNVAWIVATQHRNAMVQKELRALAVEIAGSPIGIQAGQEAVSARRALETQTREMEPFLASSDAPLSKVLVSILSKAKGAGVSMETMTLSRKNGVLHGLAPKMEQGEKVARSLNREGWITTIERKDAPAGDERVAFVIGIGRSREKR